MTNFENPGEMGSASSGLEGGECSPSSAFSPSFSLEDKSRRLFFRVAQPRRMLSPVFKIVVAKVDTLIGPQAARMLTLEGGPFLVSHVLIKPWTRNVDLFVVERVALEVELSFRELGYRDLITNVERK